MIDVVLNGPITFNFMLDECRIMVVGPDFYFYINSMIPPFRFNRYRKFPNPWEYPEFLADGLVLEDPVPRYREQYLDVLVTASDGHHYYYNRELNSPDRYTLSKAPGLNYNPKLEGMYKLRTKEYIFEELKNHWGGEYTGDYLQLKYVRRVNHGIMCSAGAHYTIIPEKAIHNGC